MSEPRAQRTLVKSPPELWAEISDVSTLARHLGEFGDIRITRLEAETTVVWEGDRARGTVNLEPSGWGTKVTITAEAVAEEVAEVVEPEPEVVEEPVAEAVEEPVAEVIEPEPDPVAPAPEPEPAPRRRGFFARLFGRRQAPAAPTAEPVAAEPVAPEPEPEPTADAELHVPTVAAPEPVAEPELDGEIAAAAATPAAETLDAARVEAVLVSVLDDLGAAHHRPFSRG